jgi:hypothetical protein
MAAAAGPSRNGLHTLGRWNPPDHYGGPSDHGLTTRNLVRRTHWIEFSFQNNVWLNFEAGKTRHK